MGQLVRIRRGQWAKTDDGGWKFEPDASDVDQFIFSRSNEAIESFTKLVREVYQLPRCMVKEDSSTNAPLTLSTSEDIEIMMSVKEWKNEVHICVTCGALNIAKFQFLCRTPFTIGDITYLTDGVKDDGHSTLTNGNFFYAKNSLFHAM